MTAPDRGTIKPKSSCIEGAVHTWLDATYVKVREAGRIVPVAVTIAVGVNSDGRREVLGMAIGASEAETFWLDFLRSLTRRGPMRTSPHRSTAGGPAAAVHDECH